MLELQELLEGALCMIQGIRMLLSLAVGYLLGGLSPAVMMGRIKGYDVRSGGTGNAGASNTVLMAGTLAGAVVAFLDILKAFAACMLGRALGGAPMGLVVGGVGAVLGHMFPVHLSFRGGKGLACIGGVILACDPRVFLPLVGVALAIIFVTRAPSVVAPVISVTWPLVYGLRSSHWLGAAVLAAPVIPIVIKHVPNFRRIARGDEPRMRLLWRRDEELRRMGRK